VDASTIYQTLDGFGQATGSVLVYPGGKTLSDSLRAAAVAKAYGQVGLNMGTIGVLLESPGDYDQRQNDNGDPLTVNWRGFSSFNLDNASRYVVDPARPFGFTSYYLGAEAPNVRWGSPWLADIRQRDYNAYLDEAAEQVLASVTFWKNTHGEEPPFYQLGNEQLSGNIAMINPDLSGYGNVDPVQQIVDVVKRAGARLRAAGFQNTRFLVGSEETEEISPGQPCGSSDPDAPVRAGDRTSQLPVWGLFLDPVYSEDVRGGCSRDRTDRRAQPDPRPRRRLRSTGVDDRELERRRAALIRRLPGARHSDP
jgi:hypothetical protein